MNYSYVEEPDHYSLIKGDKIWVDYDFCKAKALVEKVDLETDIVYFKHTQGSRFYSSWNDHPDGDIRYARKISADKVRKYKGK